MTAVAAITIVGGGLAGLSLGIALRQRKIPVVLWEAGQYPRHRVCGEFISGRGVQALQRMDLLDSVRQAEPRLAQTAMAFSEQKSFRRRTLPEPALCISRFT